MEGEGPKMGFLVKFHQSKDPIYINTQYVIEVSAISSLDTNGEVINKSHILLSDGSYRMVDEPLSFVVDKLVDGLGGYK